MNVGVSPGFAVFCFTKIPKGNEKNEKNNKNAQSAADAGSYTGGSECSEQADRLLHRAVDFGSGRILDIPQLTGKPGECDLAFYFSGSVHWDSGSAPDSKRSTWENQ